jgi:hypothetical protein
MSQIKEFIFKVAAKLGKEFDEVTDQDIQNEVEKLYEIHEASSVCDKCNDSCLDCSDLDITEKMINLHL